MLAAADELQGITQRIVELVHPLKIILFGSLARRGDEEPRDIDLLVVMPNGTHRRETTHYIYKSLSGFKKPCDIIVSTLDDLERFKDNPGLIFQTVLREGREIYAA
jgi:uncharacterized protein